MDPLEVLSRNPANGSTDVAGGTQLTATFSQSIGLCTGTITIGQMEDQSLVESFDAASSSRLSFNDTELTIDPSVSLSRNAVYLVGIPPAAVLGEGWPIIRRRCMGF